MFINSFKYRKRGFTLAEVLITLGVIGIVAAMTLPALINNIQNRALQSELKKGYSEILQAFNLMEADTGGKILPSNYAPRSFAAEYVKYFKKLRSTDKSFDSLDRTDSDYNQLKTYKTYNKAKYVFYNVFDDGQFTLPDGSLVMINNEAYNQLYISIDVNGTNKKPNIWGKDLFTFEVTRQGKLLPMGADGTTYTDMDTYCSKNSSSKMNGIACAAKALSEKDYFKK